MDPSCKTGGDRPGPQGGSGPGHEHKKRQDRKGPLNQEGGTDVVPSPGKITGGGNQGDDFEQKSLKKKQKIKGRGGKRVYIFIQARMVAAPKGRGGGMEEGRSGNIPTRGNKTKKRAGEYLGGSCQKAPGKTPIHGGHSRDKHPIHS